MIDADRGFLPLPADDALTHRRTFDLPGFLLLAPAMVLFLYGADNIREHSGQLCFAFAIVMIAVFAPGALRKGPEALLDMRLIRGGVFPVSARTQFLQNGIMYATQMLLPLYLIRAYGRTPGEVGVLLLPLRLGMLAAFPSMGWLTKHFGIRNLAAGGSLIGLLSALPFLYIADHRMVGPIFVVSLLLQRSPDRAVPVCQRSEGDTM